MLEGVARRIKERHGRQAGECRLCSVRGGLGNYRRFNFRIAADPLEMASMAVSLGHAIHLAQKRWIIRQMSCRSPRSSVS